ncbi:hypothetical protein VTJ49DRAFT_6928 [Mycothermus thermophilus]|uniref:AAA+ ATPase domain-containing protein n=1 Tax=Humicola insolens TaxID=85995 RepID=A0ABR3VJJ7_HUMIN
MSALTAIAMAGDTPPINSAIAKPLHPFFTQSRSATSTAPKHETEPSTVDLDKGDDSPDVDANTEAPSDAGGHTGTRRGRRRKADDEPHEEPASKPPHKKRTRNSAGGDITNHFVKEATEEAGIQGRSRFLRRAKKAEAAPGSPKTKKSSNSPISARTIVYWSTPCSPKKPRAVPTPKGLMPQFGVKNFGLKFPGSKLPAWPWQGMIHIRGNEDEPVLGADEPLPFPCRKSKGRAVKMAPGETVTNLVASLLDIPAIAKAVKDINTDDFIPPPPELRLPQKHFESGRKLRNRILPELATLAYPSLKRSIQDNGTEPRPPPQLARLFDSVCTSLSAFDMSQCETASWVQKYAPVSAVEVLQPGREAFFLREWLQALMVQSVDTGSTDSDKAKKGKGVGGGKKKRRKKLDGFIVSSEDEDYELYELSDQDEDWAPSGSRGIIRKTVVRSGNLGRGKDGNKTLNTLIISGPPGCGKTAAVYAVAKELDFEVFEINASSRRSGKDVLERIGDMTRNHHVQQHQVDNHDSQPAPAEDDTAQDIKAGKQATMNAFFKAKPNGFKPKPSAPNPTKGSPKEGKKEPTKSQRQSLILLEEVDILYEEDKQFWATIVGLIAQAKRPFIMTCNDETLLPFHMLQLHGIFRLSPPPKDLAVDRLILIAANEGHALSRQAVEQLYDSRKHDLRAATMDLQYWCQIGVGDRRGGFDWFYPRWPKGVDLDENKDVVRVVSQDTYLSGMNVLSRDGIVDPKTSPRLVEEEILHQAWEFWGFDMGHWQDSTGLTCWAENLPSTTGGRAAQLRNLEAYVDLAEAMSVADVCSQRSFATFKEEAIDTAQPEASPKTQDDQILGVTHLDTPFITHHNNLTTSIATTIKSLAKHSLQLHTTQSQPSSTEPLQPLTELQAIQCLQTSFTTPLPSTPRITRMDFAFAFDPIAASDSSSQPMSYLDPSVFDRTLNLIALDVAPYVRGIVAHDCRVQKQRLKLGNLVSQGGQGGAKRMRTTRSSLSALEGRARGAMRGERWFKAEVNPYLVAKTAGEGWDVEGWGDVDVTPKKTKRAGGLVGELVVGAEEGEESPGMSPGMSPEVKTMVKKGKKRASQALLDEEDELGC